MSPSKFRLGFHFSRYDDFYFTTNHKKRNTRCYFREQRALHSLFTFLPSEEIVSFVNQFQSHRFHIFARVQESYHAGNAYVQTIVDAYLEVFALVKV